MRGARVIAVLLTLATVTLTATAKAQVPELPPLHVPPPVGPPTSGNPPPKGGSQHYAPPSHGTVTDGVNPEHSGLLGDYTLIPPLKPRWRVATNAYQLLAADGRVFELGSRLRTRAASSGHVLWQRRTAADGKPFDGDVRGGYDHGILLVQRCDDLIAFDARTGRQLWMRTLEYACFSGWPVATGGVVYLAHGYSLVAIRAADGQVLWESGAYGGGIVGVDATRVYATGDCGSARAVDRRNGHVLWSRDGHCSSGGAIAHLYGGRFFLQGGELETHGERNPAVVDAATGHVLYRRRPAPALFDDGVAIAYSGFHSDRVVARSAASGKRLWQSPHTVVRDPIAVGHGAFTFVRRESASDYRLAGFDVASGIGTWDSGRSIRVYESDPLGLVALPGMLLARTRGRLEAYSSSVRPSRGRIGLAASPTDVYAGSTSVVSGVLGAGVRTGRPRVRLARSRGRHRLRSWTAVKPAPDGGFRVYARAIRNTRLRASARGTHSRVVTVYAYPRIKVGRAHRAGGYVRVGVRVWTPRTRVAGRLLYLYLGHGRYVRRIGGARLRGARGKAHTVVSFRPLSHVSRKDRLYACIRGALHLGFGRPDDFGRHCGAHRLRP